MSRVLSPERINTALWVLYGTVPPYCASDAIGVDSDERVILQTASLLSCMTAAKPSARRYWIGALSRSRNCWKRKANRFGESGLFGCFADLVVEDLRITDGVKFSSLHSGLLQYCLWGGKWKNRIELQSLWHTDTGQADRYLQLRYTFKGKAMGGYSSDPNCIHGVVTCMHREH